MFHLDYLSCFLTILATVLVGRRSWTGLLISMVNSSIVCVIGFRTSQFGFIPANVICICVYAFSLRSWLKAARTSQISTDSNRRDAISSGVGMDATRATYPISIGQGRLKLNCIARHCYDLLPIAGNQERMHVSKRLAGSAQWKAEIPAVARTASHDLAALKRMLPGNFRTTLLVNNAGTVPRPILNSDVDDMSRTIALRVG